MASSLPPPATDLPPTLPASFSASSSPSFLHYLRNLGSKAPKTMAALYSSPSPSTLSPQPPGSFFALTVLTNLLNEIERCVVLRMVALEWTEDSGITERDFNSWFIGSKKGEGEGSQRVMNTSGGRSVLILARSLRLGLGEVKRPLHNILKPFSLLLLVRQTPFPLPLLPPFRPNLHPKAPLVPPPLRSIKTFPNTASNLKRAQRLHPKYMERNPTLPRRHEKYAGAQSHSASIFEGGEKLAKVSDKRVHRTLGALVKIGLLIGPLVSPF